MTLTHWINKDTRTFMSRGYLAEGQTVEERIKQIATKAEEYLGIDGFAVDFEEQLMAGWVSLASPIWSNYGLDRGLPISCNGSYIDDSIDDILFKTLEIGVQTKHGAGTSAYLGGIRNRGSVISTGGSADGPVHYADLLEATTNIVSQSSVRRGSCAIYLPINHPDINEFLEIREEGNSIQHLSLGVTITDEWMQSMVDGDKDKRKIWMRVIRKRFETGYPYIFFHDTVNKNKPKEIGETIWASNLCSEIALPSDIDHTFVCCLSSLNLLKYDEWKDSTVVRNLVYFLDSVISEYIRKTEGVRGFETARNFSEKYRAIGVGTLGWHSYLQSKMIPFEGLQAQMENVAIHQLISERALEASQELVQRGFDPVLGSDRRNATLMAIAPTTSSSFILGQVSPSVEPLNSNYFVKDLAKGKFTYRNPYLKEVLSRIEKDSNEVWESILLHGGSVQHLSFLSDHEKSVFKTFGEISQYEIIVQAADRQKFIDQSQSINLMIHPQASAKDVHQLLVEGWKLGMKTFYYQRSTNPAQEYARNLLQCVSCEA
jgi:ribonucleoside-diphosphate reductase alpha chain